jgi:hypothetical protein
VVGVIGNSGMSRETAKAAGIYSMSNEKNKTAYDLYALQRDL